MMEGQTPKKNDGRTDPQKMTQPNRKKEEEWYPHPETEETEKLTELANSVTDGGVTGAKKMVWAGSMEMAGGLL